MSTKEKQRPNYKIIWRLLAQVKPYRTRFTITGLIVIFLAAVSPIRPLLVQIGIDDKVAVGDHQGFLHITLLFVGLLIIEAILFFFQTYLANWVAQSVTLDMRSRLYKKVLTFRLRFFDKTPVGTFVTRIVSDIDGVAQMFSNGILTIIGDLLRLFVVIIYMLYLNWALTLIVLIPIPILLFVTSIFQRVIRNALRIVRNQVTKMNVFVQEHVTGMSIVQIFNREKREIDKFEEINREHRSAHIRTVWAFSIFFPVVELLSAASVALALWWGIGEIVAEKIQIGMLMQFILYNFMIYRPIRQLADRFTVLQEGMVNGERVFKEIDREEAIPDEGKIENVDFKGEIEFKNLWFSYKDEVDTKETDWVLKDISFSVKAGETVAFVGATGAGKSSVINLLNRFYSFQKGELCIDGEAIQDYSLNEVRKNIAVVLQDVFLFSDSIHNNITLLNPEITKEDVIEAAKQVGAHEFISKLPGGYDYNVRERGGMLSVGQRQLLAFIRAYVYNPKILVLDEATSSVDTESEDLIKMAIDKLTEGRTSIIIAHRLSTIQKADKIIVMDKGRIVEYGSHYELLENDSFYKRLFDMQFVD